MKYLAMTDEIFNMIWSAGFDSGAKVENECANGVIPAGDEIEFNRRKDELLNQDADGIIELMHLKRQMGG